VVFEPGRLAGVSQRLQTVLLSTCCSLRKARQLEQHPRAGIELPYPDVHRITFRLDREFAACPNVGFSVGHDLIATAGNKSGPWRCQRASDAATTRSNFESGWPATSRDTATTKIHAANIT